MNTSRSHGLLCLVLITAVFSLGVLQGQDRASGLPEQARLAMKQAATFFRHEVAQHGGYVYHYSVDLKYKWGEGEATPDQIWVQPPGTPTVGLAYLAGFRATGDRFYLEAVQEVAEALIHGQLASGGWTNCIDFDPNGKRVAQYRNAKYSLPKNAKNYSSLDDGQTQTATRFMVLADQALQFGNIAIHESAKIALDSLLAAQFPCGAFPQVWAGPVEPVPPVKASYPSYDWRTEGRIKEYWTLYTLNDDTAVYVAETLRTAWEVYGEDRYLEALKRLGDFLILAQMPAPQPAWAQQYNYQMQPVWARAFEPPGISGRESQGAIEILMDLYAICGEPKYLEPIPAALKYLRSSELPDGQLARYYELQTNQPLYMTRSNDKYTLTYDDRDLPEHYGWKTPSEVDALSSRYETIQAASPNVPADEGERILREAAVQAIETLDNQGRWISISDGQRLIGQLVLPPGRPYVASQVFYENMSILANFVAANANH
jgi:hypothetical protein